MRREPAHLIFEGEFVIPMRRAREATLRLARNLALADATWEPIDWSEFD